MMHHPRQQTMIVTPRPKVTFCVQGVVSPILSNLFLHYVFDKWMERTHPSIPFERYADDMICHCRSAEEARALEKALEARFTACKLVMHPQKTQLVYCKDVNRCGDYPNQSFDFLGYRFRPRKSIWHGRQYVVSFLPGTSPKALKTMGQTLRRWCLHHRSDKSLQDLAQLYNGYIRGWINYFRHFYGSALHPVLHRIDAYLVRWARRKFKRLHRRPRWAQQWLARVRRANPDLFAHWRFAYANG
jgi:hypothetical protein